MRWEIEAAHDKKLEMKYVTNAIIPLLVLSGCTSVIMEDTTDNPFLTTKNEYFDVQNYKDPDAAYIGEWTTTLSGGMVSIKINGNGYFKSCAENEHFGQANGKAFKKGDKIVLIHESGTQEEIIKVEARLLTTKSYSREINYHRDETPERCKEIFRNF